MIVIKCFSVFLSISFYHIFHIKYNGIGIFAKSAKRYIFATDFCMRLARVEQEKRIKWSKYNKDDRQWYFEWRNWILFFILRKEKVLRRIICAKKINFEGGLTFLGNELTAFFSFLINLIWYNADKQTKGLIKIYYLAWEQPCKKKPFFWSKAQKIFWFQYEYLGTWIKLWNYK